MLAAPVAGLTGTSTYLVRLGDKRDPDISGLKARDIFSLRGRLVGEQYRDFQETAFDPRNDSFKGTFGLWLRSWDREAERAAEKAAADAADAGDA